MSLTIMRRLKFCAGHRLFEYAGKCEHFHGHNYVVDLFITADQQDDVGRVFDFSHLKKRANDWLDKHWDHSFLVYDKDQNAIDALKLVKPSRMFLMPYNPTAENMAKYLLEVAAPEFMSGTGVQVDRVRMWETDESYAEASLRSSHVA
jgi:6-pyruvoyltetrahydropterin/6-carboxytetrahydropterin synthase